LAVFGNREDEAEFMGSGIKPFAGGNAPNIAMDIDFGIICQRPGSVNGEKARMFALLIRGGIIGF